jgi:hypothetical protein
MTLTDDGPDIANQPSRLWCSREQFQEKREPHIPVSRYGPGATQQDPQAAMPTIQAMRASIETLSHVATPPTAAQTSSRNIPRPDLSLLASPTPQHDRNAISELTGLRTRCEQVTKRLLDNSMEDVHEIHDQLRSARDLLESATQSAAATKRNADSVLDEKKELLESLKRLRYAAQIIESSLPPDTRPISVDTSKRIIL